MNLGGFAIVAWVTECNNLQVQWRAQGQGEGEGEGEGEGAVAQSCTFRGAPL